MGKHLRSFLGGLLIGAMLFAPALAPAQITYRGPSSFTGAFSATTDCLSWNSDTYICRESAAVVQHGNDAATATAQEIKAPDSTGANVAGANLTISAGDGTNGDAAGGTLFLAGGLDAGSGTTGAVTIKSGAGDILARFDPAVGEVDFGGASTGWAVINTTTNTYDFCRPSGAGGCDGNTTSFRLVNNSTFARIPAGALTSATMTAEAVAHLRHSVSSYTWTTAQVNTALGAGTTGDITVATLPAKTQVRNAYVVITEAAAGPATLTVSCADANDGTPFDGYILPSDAKAAANTIYGDAVAERGTQLDVEWYYVSAYAATTLVTCHFIAGDATDLTTGQGRVILETVILP